MQIGIFSQTTDVYQKILRVFALKLIPFMKQHYFGGTGEGANISGGYTPSKKAVVVTFFTKMRIYDESLYSNFAKHLGVVLSQANYAVAKSDSASQLLKFEKAVQTVVCT